MRQILRGNSWLDGWETTDYIQDRLGDLAGHAVAARDIVGCLRLDYASVRWFNYSDDGMGRFHCELKYFYPDQRRL